MKNFNTKTFGKWILAGEHSVLRGKPALAFPLLNRYLELEYHLSSEPLKVDFTGEHGSEINLLFYGVLENAMSKLKASGPPKGYFKIYNSLPIGAGLGASAALCGAVARWCASQDHIASDKVYEFARELEDLFHGESSGVDLAVSLSANGIRFVRSGERINMAPLWWPNLYLSYSGQRGMTSDCVAKVKRMFEVDRGRAEAIDDRMLSAVELAQKSLALNEAEGLTMLEEAIRKASSCFEDWGLCFGELSKHISDLRSAGALAVKPTGSGGGGYVLSLWKSTPPDRYDGLLFKVQAPVIKSN